MAGRWVVDSAGLHVRSGGVSLCVGARLRLFSSLFKSRWLSATTPTATSERRDHTHTHHPNESPPVHPAQVQVVSARVSGGCWFGGASPESPAPRGGLGSAPGGATRRNRYSQ